VPAVIRSAVPSARSPEFRNRRGAGGRHGWLSYRPAARPSLLRSVSASTLVRPSRRCAAMSRKTWKPASVAWTRTTRRSSVPCRRSTKPRFSMRSTIPVALASDTSIASASCLHRKRSLGLEGCQNVEVDKAERVLVPRFEDAATVARRPAGHLFEQLARESLAAVLIAGPVGVGAPGHQVHST